MGERYEIDYVPIQGQAMREPGFVTIYGEWATVTRRAPARSTQHGTPAVLMYTTRVMIERWLEWLEQEHPGSVRKLS